MLATVLNLNMMRVRLLSVCRTCRWGFNYLSGSRSSHKRTIVGVHNIFSKDFYYRKNKFSTKSSGKLSSALMPLTYLSFGIGGILLLAIIKKQYDKVKRRLNGIEDLPDPLMGKRGYCRIRYKDFILPDFIKDYDNLLNIENFTIRTDDIWVVSFPRSGSTWTGEIVYLVMNEANTEKAKKNTIEERFPYLEYIYPGLSALEKSHSPRLIKSHLPYQLLPKQIEDKKPKIIYVARNPKDVCVSYHHFMKGFAHLKYKGSLQDTFDSFLNDKTPYSPWWKHVKVFWEHGNDDNILFLKYEDMKRDLSSTVRKIAAFLEKALTDDQIDTIVKHCSFESMSKNDSTNFSWWGSLGISHKDAEPFMRKGDVGDWRNHFTPKMTFDMDRKFWLKFKDSGLVLDSSLTGISSMEDCNKLDNTMQAH